MPLNKYSRRKFIGMSSLIAGIPSGVLALAYKTAGENLLDKSMEFASGNASDLERIASLLEEKRAIKWLFTGDSITAGVEHTHGLRSYPEIFEERIHWEMKRSRDLVINTAISGNTCTDILIAFNWRIEQFRPGIVSVMIGTNDCAKEQITVKIFQRNLDVLTDRIRGLHAIPILQTPNVIISELAPERADLGDYVKVIQRTAMEKSIILVDNYAFWQKQIKEKLQENIFKEWLNDPLHPNGNGHKEIARLMFKELSIFNSNDPTCGGKYYEGRH